MSWRIIAVVIDHETDVVAVRQRARQIAALVGFDIQDQTRFTTAASEIARNAFEYAGGGRVEFRVEGRAPPQALEIIVRDDGPGIADLAAVLDGSYSSEHGMGVGILGARRLVDEFAIDSEPGRGTEVRMRKYLPRKAPLLGPAAIGRIADKLAAETVGDPVGELRRQNRELLLSLDELRRRQEELTALSNELQDTNRGVVALYAELDERAEHLRRADELKSRFLSNMSHEFRTPLNSVLALSRLLLDRADGDLTAEQERQVRYIRQSAQNLAELVNDLLDIAKVEAGKIDVRPSEFSAAELFGALRGVMRPLLNSDAVALVFDEPAGLPPLVTDEAKVAQILRNFISNAIKFTEHGEVRVSAIASPNEEWITFVVRDTGIGIAPENHAVIFEEFSQLDSPVQRRVKGTGLGLPLSKRLAELLGGRVALESALGGGSAFHLILPRRYGAATADAWPAVEPPRPPAREPPASSPIAVSPASGRHRLLVVDDEDAARYIIRQFLAGLPCEIVEAQHGVEALERIAEERPDAVVLDLDMPELDGFAVLERIVAAEPSLPVFVVTSAVLDNALLRRLAGARAVLAKGDLSSEALLKLLEGEFDDIAAVP